MRTFLGLHRHTRYAYRIVTMPILLSDATSLLQYLLAAMTIIAALLYVVLGIVLWYHWSKYGVKRLRAAILHITYWILGIVFLSLMASATLSL